mmetsp:Transcript_631/g.1135  ORF Transcript_631/g.1135 Transcript_631/m.1135 type:complete len:308 (-) Transcript_631:2370-3293(-)
MLLLAFSALAAAISVPIHYINSRPVVGVVTAPSFVANFTAELPLSYLKWVESAGARTVVINHEEPSHVLDYILDSVNAVLLTGDSEGPQACSYDSQYMQTVGYIFSKVAQKNQAGTYLPLWGTCLGMEALQHIVSQACSSSDAYSNNTMLSTQLTSEGYFSQLFMASDAKLRSSLQADELVYHDHEYATRLTAYAENEQLRKFFRVVAISRDTAGEFFISAIEAKALPIFAVMWHPEKPQFVWSSSISNSPGAVAAAQYFANFFVSQARMNNQTFPDEEALQVFSTNKLVPDSSLSHVEATFLFPKH